MYPFITLFGHTISSYSIMTVIGILAVFIYALIRCRQTGIDISEEFIYLTFAFIFLMIGAVILYQLTNIKELIRLIPYLFTDFTYFRTHITTGIVFYGGLLGALCGCMVYSCLFHQDTRKMLMHTVPVIPLFHFWGRIGCFLAGCCHGIENTHFGIAYVNSPMGENGIPFLPVQLYEAAGNLIIFIILLFNQKRVKKIYQPLGIYLTMYGTMRFLLEFLRGDDIRGHLGILSTSQWISLVIIPFGIYCLVVKEEKNCLNRLYNRKS